MIRQIVALAVAVVAIGACVVAGLRTGTPTPKPTATPLVLRFALRPLDQPCTPDKGAMQRYVHGEIAQQALPELTHLRVGEHFSPRLDGPVMTATIISGDRQGMTLYCYTGGFQ